MRILFTVKNAILVNKVHSDFLCINIEYQILTAISRHADIESPVPSICFKPKSFVSGRDFNSLSGTLKVFQCNEIDKETKSYIRLHYLTSQWLNTNGHMKYSITTFN